MWNRISNGIVSAQKKCAGDHEMFVNYVLEFIKAYPVLVAANKRLERWLMDFEQLDENAKIMMLKILEKKHNVILVYSRNLWNDIKNSNKQLKDGE